MLTELRLVLPSTDGGFLGKSLGFWDGAETDSGAVGKIRQEQADLRRALLQGRPAADCALCGARLPARLLIAGHIKPRSLCSEEERRDFNSAMLVCSLGCDVLFEWGYVVVDGTGRVRPCRVAETFAVEAAVAAISGKYCTAFNEHTSAKFADHARITAEG